MTKNPLAHALAANVYIVLVVVIMNATATIEHDAPMLVMPILFISLFTLSAAVMGYLFGYYPLALFLEGKKKEGVSFFLKTVGYFAIVPFVIAITYLVSARL
ncbi:MAG: hypothetical protein QY312_03795 [Candidatus Dojkabacteria bacterium]|nr:MAG: hypothetical protein QY312_03795 [Candidatus Dojkabacteria bacterium]